MNDVSNHPLRRSTRPLDSGSFGGSSTSLTARVPMNNATPSARRCPRPMPGSLSQISRRGTRPSCRISSHDPSSRSSVFRVGIIRPVMNRECAAVITSTGSSLAVPSSSGIFLGGNHRSHCAASPGSQTSRSAGSIRRCSGRSRRTFSRNHVIDPCHPTRSAITVAGNSASTSSRARTRASNGVNAVGCRLRSYLGGASEATVFTTVVREIPSRTAIRDFGTPSAASLLISAHSSTVITLQSLSVHFSSAVTVQFSSVADTGCSGPAQAPLMLIRAADGVHLVDGMPACSARRAECVARLRPRMKAHFRAAVGVGTPAAPSPRMRTRPIPEESGAAGHQATLLTHARHGCVLAGTSDVTLAFN
jgi:hypothetical protein